MITTRYARTGDVSIAYQVTGDGPVDIVYLPGWVSNVEVMWEEPETAAFLQRLASFSRLIAFDKRGTGMSDRVAPDQLPGLEVRMADLAAVMEAAGSNRATLMGHSEGGNLAILYAATYPDRVDKLILIGSYARRIWSEDYPWAPTREERQAEVRAAAQGWGEPEDYVGWIAPSRAGDLPFVQWLGRYLRLSATPRDAATLLEMNSQIDTTMILPSIQVPTLCVYKTRDVDVKVEEGRWIAGRIPTARLVEIDSADHWLAGEGSDQLLDAVEEFVTGQHPPARSTRMLTTVLFTDIVGSTVRASEMGDEAWRRLLESHHALVRNEISRFHGREISTAGDGFLATFDGPARAVRAGQAITAGVTALGLQVRAGVHTGEVELVGDDIAGLSVHIGARIAALGGPGEVLVSRTVKDLVAGSGLEFADRGEHPLKGVPEPWRVYAALAEA